MTKSKADAAKIHFIDFKDHASRPAETFWSGQKHRVLPPLPSLCFYFVHPDFNLDELDLRAFWRDVIDGLYGPFRFEMFCIPGEELKARGDIFEQVREASRAYKDPEYAAARKAQGKLPGLVTSHRYPGALVYHGLVIIYKDATWNREDEDKTFDVIKFGPALTSEDLELGDKIIRINSALSSIS
ncbi:hypothetical protein FG05_06431 [Fusarium graminearum]|nr:hypothetical protein FG05_06431 [Fusarium graminearum]